MQPGITVWSNVLGRLRAASRARDANPGRSPSSHTWLCPTSPNSTCAHCRTRACAAGPLHTGTRREDLPQRTSAARRRLVHACMTREDESRCAAHLHGRSRESSNPCPEGPRETLGTKPSVLVARHQGPAPAARLDSPRYAARPSCCALPRASRACTSESNLAAPAATGRARFPRVHALRKTVNLRVPRVQIAQRPSGPEGRLYTRVGQSAGKPCGQRGCALIPTLCFAVADNVWRC